MTAEFVPVIAVSTTLAEIQIGRFLISDTQRRDELSCDAHLLEMSIDPLPTVNQAIYFHNGQRELAQLGDLFYCPSGHRLSRKIASAGRIVRCSFSEDKLEEMFGCRGQWPRRVLHEAMDIQSPAVRAALVRAVREASTPGLASEVLLEGLFIQIAVELARYFYDKTDSSQGGLPGWQIKRIRERAQSDMSSPPSLKELAALCGISERHLIRGFKQSCGETIGEYLEGVRLRHAKTLLLAGAMPLKQVAHAVGFAKPGSFSSAFRKSMGMTPSEFRQEHAILEN